jgi:SNF2 family DNA or RNA helicase
MNDYKFPKLQNVQDIIDKKEKVVIFSQWTAMLAIYAHHFTPASYPIQDYSWYDLKPNENKDFH